MFTNVLTSEAGDLIDTLLQQPMRMDQFVCDWVRYVDQASCEQVSGFSGFVIIYMHYYAGCPEGAYRV